VNTQPFITLFPELIPTDDGRFACLSMTLPDGRYICVTNTGGMGFPTANDFNVCVYRSEEDFGNEPIHSLTSDDFADLDHALAAAEFCGEVQS